MAARRDAAVHRAHADVRRRALRRGARAVSAAMIRARARGRARARWCRARRPRRTPGPARYWALARDPGREVGIISAMTEHFCDDCNRLRLTAIGALHACLGHDDALSLRDVLRAGASDDDVVRAIARRGHRQARGHTFRRRPAPAREAHDRHRRLIRRFSECGARGSGCRLMRRCRPCSRALTERLVWRQVPKMRELLGVGIGPEHATVGALRASGFAETNGANSMQKSTIDKVLLTIAVVLAGGGFLVYSSIEHAQHYRWSTSSSVTGSRTGTTRS